MYDTVPRNVYINPDMNNYTLKHLWGESKHFGDAFVTAETYVRFVQYWPGDGFFAVKTL